MKLDPPYVARPITKEAADSTRIQYSADPPEGRGFLRGLLYATCRSEIITTK